jgi:hypothetical protein
MFAVRAVTVKGQELPLEVQVARQPPTALSNPQHENHHLLVRWELPEAAILTTNLQTWIAIKN